MKKSQIYSMILLVWLLLLLLSTFTPAATPSYVGIENNDTFMWDTTYDEDSLENIIEDNFEEAGKSDSYIDNYIDTLDVQDDLVGIKIVILDVDDEETSPWGEDGVRIIYNHYMMKEDEEWDLENEDETFAIWDYDKDVYVPTGFLENGMDFLNFDWKFEYPSGEDPERYKFLKGSE